MIANLLGFFGGIGTTLSFIPQVSTLCMARDASDTEGLCLSMFVIHWFGLTCWVVYGVLIHAYIVCVFNAIAEVLVSYCILKLVLLRYMSSSEENDALPYTQA